MSIIFNALPIKTVQAIRVSQHDHYDKLVEKSISDGTGNPCRHCLKDIPKGASMLTLAYCPFETRNPYAETGPIFLCETDCKRAMNSKELPEIFNDTTHILMRGYGKDERIIYGTGQVVEVANIMSCAELCFNNTDVQFIDLRSASNNCFQCRITQI